MINPALIFYSANPLDSIVKYVYSNSPFVPTNGAEVISGYNTGYTDASTIETYFGVGVTGITSVDIFYIRGSTYLTETINVDTTNSNSFWTDINGWLYLNNFYDITYDAGLDRWAINDTPHIAYIYMLKGPDVYITMSGTTYITMSGDTYITI